MIKQRIARIIGVLIFCSFFSTQSTFADLGDGKTTNRELVRTLANFYFRQKDFKMAQQVLSDHLDLDPDDAHAWNLTGLSAMESGELPQAKSAFFEASKRGKGPDRGVFLYYYAGALAKDGDISKAIDALKIAQRYPLVEKSATAALKKLLRLKAGGIKDGEKSEGTGLDLPEVELNRPGDFSASVFIGSGYDTNVLQTPEKDASSLEASQMGSASALLGAQARYVKLNGDVQWKSQLGFNTVYYLAETSKSSSSISPSLLFEREKKNLDLSGWGWGLGNKIDVIFINSSGFNFFNVSEQITLQGTYRWSLESETVFKLPVYYRYYKRADSDSVKTDRTGPGLNPQVAQRRKFGSWITQLGLEYDQMFSKGNEFRNRQITVPLQVGNKFFWSSMVMLKPEFSFTLYPDASTSRRDLSYKAGIGWSKQFSGDWTMALDYYYRKNSSNVSNYTFIKHSVSLVVNHDF